MQRRSSLISGHGLLAADSAFIDGADPGLPPLGCIKATVFALVFPVVTELLATSLLERTAVADFSPLLAAVPALGALAIGAVMAKTAINTARSEAAESAPLRDPNCLLDLRKVMSERRDWLYENQGALAATPAADGMLSRYAHAVSDEYERFLKGHIGSIDPSVTTVEEKLTATLASEPQLV